MKLTLIKRAETAALVLIIGCIIWNEAPGVIELIAKSGHAALINHIIIGCVLAVTFIFTS